MRSSFQSNSFQDISLLSRYLCYFSILYADIVNFTPLTADLEPEELVRALNELFGRFDQLAKVLVLYFIDMLLSSLCV